MHCAVFKMAAYQKSAYGDDSVSDLVRDFTKHQVSRRRRVTVRAARSRRLWSDYGARAHWVCPNLTALLLLNAQVKERREQEAEEREHSERGEYVRQRQNSTRRAYQYYYAQEMKVRWVGNSYENSTVQFF